MQRTLSTVCATVTMAGFAFHTTNAHGYIESPHAQFVDPTIGSKYAKTITADVNKAFGGLKWNGSPEANVATFTSSFVNAGYKSLRDMLDQQVSGCTNTRTDVSPVDVSGLTVMKWQNDEEHKGFIDSHHGPCEVWIDDIMVDHQDDCVATYGSGYPANVKADFSHCSGDCTLRFYWLALHEPNWQIYKQCVPIVNKSGTPTQKQAAYTVTNAGTQTPTTQMQFTENNPGTQTPMQVQGTVTPAGPTNEGSYGWKNRLLRTIEDAPMHLATRQQQPWQYNGATVNWMDTRFLRALNEFAAGFQSSN